MKKKWLSWALALTLILVLTGCRAEPMQQNPGLLLVETTLSPAVARPTLKPVTAPPAETESVVFVTPPAEPDPRVENLPTLAELLGAQTLSWRYLDAPERLAALEGEPWTQLGYDDSQWLSGEGAFGADHGQLKQVAEGYLPDVCLRHYLPNGDAMPAYCFRMGFTARQEDLVGPLTAEISYDDAVIVYVNGQAVFSGNVPRKGYAGFNSYGSEEVCGGPATGRFVIDPALLAVGENVLAVELHQDNKNSTDVYFELKDLHSQVLAQDQWRDTTVCLGVGADETQRLITWQGPAGYDGSVQVEPAGAGWSNFTDAVQTYPAQPVYSDGESCTYRAVLTGLEPGTYAYQVRDARPSSVFRFKVEAPQDAFSFLCHGDPQIREQDDTGAIDVYMALADYAMGDDTPLFVLSLGDQSNEDDDAGLFGRYVGAPLLKQVPLAAVVGNHERNDEMFSRFFYLPNMDGQTVQSAGDMSGDYWFYQGNVLFLALNSNNSDVEAHARFMQEARQACIAQYGEPVWVAVAMHHSLFSAGSHAMDDSILQVREAYAQAFEAAGVDVVFSGHDHTYTRSWPMDGTEPAVQGGSGQGIVYFCLTSSTGTKFYDLYDAMFPYAALTDGSDRPCMTRVDVTDRAMTVTTFCKDGDAITVLDTYRLEKGPENTEN